jgi:hypothetical protein
MIKYDVKKYETRLHRIRREEVSRSRYIYIIKSDMISQNDKDLVSLPFTMNIIVNNNNTAREFTSKMRDYQLKAVERFHEKI